MAAPALRHKGARPPGVESADVFRDARSGYLIAADDHRTWQEIYANQFAASARAPRPHRSAGEERLLGPR